MAQEETEMKEILGRIKSMIDSILTNGKKKMTPEERGRLGASIRWAKYRKRRLEAGLPETPPPVVSSSRKRKSIPNGEIIFPELSDIPVHGVFVIQPEDARISLFQRIYVEAKIHGYSFTVLNKNNIAVGVAKATYTKPIIAIRTA